MGIDPVTHKPKSDALLTNDGQTKNAANLSHMAQWESARLEAEARLVRESKLRSHSHSHPSSSAPIESPTSTLTFTNTNQSLNMIEFVSSEIVKEENGVEFKEGIENSLSFIEDGCYTNLLLNEARDGNGDGDGHAAVDGGGSESGGSDYYQDNKNYWNSILNLVNSSPPNSPMF